MYYIITFQIRIRWRDQYLKQWQNSSDNYLLIKNKGYDLFACEAQYHRSCHKVKFRKPTNLSMNFDL